MTPDHDPTRAAPRDADATLPPTVTGDAAAIRHLSDGSDATVGPRAGAAPVLDAPAGFLLERELGVGGMGVVYLARPVGLNRLVALKLVKDTRVDAKALIRFLAEAEAVASILKTAVGVPRQGVRPEGRSCPQPDVVPVPRPRGAPGPPRVGRRRDAPATARCHRTAARATGRGLRAVPPK